MTPLLQDKLRVLASDELMIEAIRAIISEEIEKVIPQIRYDVPNDVIGQGYRAYMMAKELLLNSIYKIQSFKDDVGQSNNVNKGR